MQCPVIESTEHPLQKRSRHHDTANATSGDSSTSLQYTSPSIQARSEQSIYFNRKTAAFMRRQSKKPSSFVTLLSRVNETRPKKKTQIRKYPLLRSQTMACQIKHRKNQNCFSVTPSLMMPVELMPAVTTVDIISVYSAPDHF